MDVHLRENETVPVELRNPRKGERANPTARGQERCSRAKRIIHWMGFIETYVRADADGVASCAAGLLAARCAEAVSRRGVFTLALSGGSAPLTLYRLLRTEAWAAQVDWRTHAFLGG